MQDVAQMPADMAATAMGDENLDDRRNSLEYIHNGTVFAQPEDKTQPMGVVNISSTVRAVNDATAAATINVAEQGGDNTHIVGPVETADAHVLSDFLSADRMAFWRPARPRTTSEKPVMFKCVRKRPLGIAVAQTRSAQQCEIIEKMLEPWLDDLVQLYFLKVNTCFPILDKQSFTQLFNEDRSKISPALLSCLYANSLTYWTSSEKLKLVRCPDVRFIWNCANESLYSELHISPAISTIVAILMNIGGRPTTSIMGNSTQIGSAVSLAYVLGLNRDPSEWDIPDRGKALRIRTWWAVVVHDTWCGLAYGTPPHIKKRQHDVPLPSLELQAPTASENNVVFSIYCALVSLTELLGVYLDQVYDVQAHKSYAEDGLAQCYGSLQTWKLTLSDEVRAIALEGFNLQQPGAANLRLSYLAVMLLHHRTGLNISNTTAAKFSAVYNTAEIIVNLIQELTMDQLHDFWLPTSAFAITSAATSILRCALDSSVPSTAVTDNPPASLANQLITTLRHHREKSGWDVADICVAQYGDLVKTLSSTNRVPLFMGELNDFSIHEVPAVDELFPDLWDVFNNYGI